MAAAVDAASVAQALASAARYDAILLAPQVSYAKRDVQKVAPKALVWAIPMADYQRSNAKKVVNDVLAALGE